MDNSTEINSQKRFSLNNLNLKNWGTKEFLVFLFVALFIGGSISFLLLGGVERGKRGEQPSPTPQEQVFISPHTLVYGIWTEKSSLIKAYDLSVGKEYLLAELPKNIKKVTVISPTELLFINNTNERDHGTEIAIYNLENKTTRVAFKAVDGFGIDDYAISLNKRYISTWEVAFAPGASNLFSGTSRVYAIDLLNPSQKYLLYDEIATQPAHYPRGVTDNGEVFLDTFLPNSRMGWAYGMSVSNLTGTQKQDLQNMQNGTYGTQPTMSSDRRYLVFAGYDGTYGPGDEDKGGYRQAVLMPNTVDILDTQTKQRQRLSAIPKEDTYPIVTWDKTQKNTILIVRISQDEKNTGFYLYNMDEDSRTLQKAKLKDPKNDQLITTLRTNLLLEGEPEASDTAVANLGEAYSPVFKNFTIINTLSMSSSKLLLSDSFIQLISLLPSNFLSKEISLQTGPNRQTLQLQTLPLKPELASKRIEQQSAPLPPPVSGRTEVPFLSRIDTSGCTPQIGATIVKILVPTLRATCMGSPLYLYGPSGTKVKVKIETPVFSSIPTYRGKYNFTLLSDGKIKIDDNIYKSIKFDYLPAIPILPPTHGIVISREKLSDTLSYFAKNLGLKSNEMHDLIKEITQKTSSPYIFVSFFDEKTSREILPITFDPQPDTYINIVFYFKEFDKRPSFPPQSSVFPQIEPRGEFTAVEVSWTIEE